jgi:splicing factor 3A subunit 2
VAEGVQPRFRFMSAYEQKVERIDARYQYLLVAAEPYETVAFKIPNLEIDRSPGRLFTHWDTEKLTYTLQLYFKRQQRGQQQQQLLQLQQQQREQAARAAAGEGSTDMVDG